MYSVCTYIAKVVGYYDLSVLSMSVMGFQKKKFGWGSKFFWHFFNFAEPLILYHRGTCQLILLMREADNSQIYNYVLFQKGFL